MKAILSHPGLLFDAVDPTLRNSYQPEVKLTEEYERCFSSRIFTVVGLRQLLPETVRANFNLSKSDHELTQMWAETSQELTSTAQRLIKFVQEKIPTQDLQMKAIYEQQGGIRVRCDPDPNLSAEYLRSLEGRGILIAYVRTLLDQEDLGYQPSTRKAAEMTIQFLEATGFTFDVVEQSIRFLIISDPSL